MSSWILPGRKNDPLTRYKIILQQSFAFSRICNPRNTEFFWYPVWAQTLSDLVADIPNLMVAPQYPAWFVPEDDQPAEGDGNHDADDPEEIEMPGDLSTDESALSLGATDDELGDPEENGLTELSFALTVAEKNTKSVLVDFAVINVRGSPYTPQKSRYGGWRIDEAKVALLVEVKRFVSRSLTGDELKKELAAAVVEAHEDAVEQAAHLFIQYERQDHVLAIAATGPYWTNTKVSRADLKNLIHRIKENDPTYQAPGQKSDPKLKWTKPLHLGSAQSNNRLHTIYKSLKAIGVMATPGDA